MITWNMCQLSDHATIYPSLNEAYLQSDIYLNYLNNVQHLKQLWNLPYAHYDGTISSHFTTQENQEIPGNLVVFCVERSNFTPVDWRRITARSIANNCIFLVKGNYCLSRKVE